MANAAVYITHNKWNALLDNCRAVSIIRNYVFVLICCYRSKHVDNCSLHNRANEITRSLNSFLWCNKWPNKQASAHISENCNAILSAFLKSSIFISFSVTFGPVPITLVCLHRYSSHKISICVCLLIFCLSYVTTFHLDLSVNFKEKADIVCTGHLWYHYPDHSACLHHNLPTTSMRNGEISAPCKKIALSGASTAWDCTQPMLLQRQGCPITQ